MLTPLVCNWSARLAGKRLSVLTRPKSSLPYRFLQVLSSAGCGIPTCSAAQATGFSLQGSHGHCSRPIYLVDHGVEGEVSR
jgi:hypothetical protein